MASAQPTSAPAPAPYNPNGKLVGICGATGAVGEEIALVLAQRNFPVKQLCLFASSRSAGKTLKTPYGDIVVELFSVEKAAKCEYLFLAVSGDFSLQYAKELAAKGAIVIDNSSAFRYDDDIPLVVPEINGHVLRATKPGQQVPHLIANPNCTTAIAAVALWPLHCEFNIKRLVISTYQAASGAGAEGMQELRGGTEASLQNAPIKNKVFAHPLPFNLIPHIDKFQANGYTKEEMKVTWETRKIFEEPKLQVSCTAVRVPIMRAHSEAITFECERKVDISRARELLSKADGVRLVDNPAALKYPMPMNATKKFHVEAGRVRPSLIFGDYGLDLFVSGDQLLRGAALNAVLIAEFMEKPSAKAQFTKKKTCCTRELRKTTAYVLAGAVLGATAVHVARALGKSCCK